MTGALASADTMRDLVSRSAADMGMRCIALQRQYIEHCGIEADFGCRVLAQVLTAHSNDAELLHAFREFTQACRQVVQEAMLIKAAPASGTNEEGGSTPRQLAGLRFGVGSRVSCFIGDRWENGRVIAVGVEAPKAMHAPEGTRLPYQVRLDIGPLVFAPMDNDSVIRSEADAPANSDSDPATTEAQDGKELPSPRFKVGTRVTCRMKPGVPGEWANGTVVRLHYRHPHMQQGFVAPYQVSVDLRPCRDPESVQRTAAILTRPLCKRCLRHDGLPRRTHASFKDALLWCAIHTLRCPPYG